ncbi:heavy metal translocating P-type ATPase [Pelagibacterium sp. 26DY04]|uniref:heavy metal translocating P-type ATPase n=1 Tax=Pelagibacterium sp. 26DY04 TaxID=2967130 RepID=UPI002814CF0F|nr:heavy metal translocating P-type ATPase [Pelagibacterium sp. 26DY04]WMT86523.1 heavy metal translocating P-type ATPase [Pelagibacterium sp. 26DY04]
MSLHSRHCEGTSPMDHHNHHDHDHSGPNSGDAGEHDKHAGHSVAMFRDKFWLSLALTVPTVIWEPMIQEWFGYTAPQFPGSAFIPAVFGTIVFFYGGWVFLRSALGELQARLPGMMTLISLAIMVAFLYSVAVLLGLDGHPLWWELATLVTIMLLGHWIEMRSISQAQGALNELAKLLPDMAVRVIGDDQSEEVLVSDLRADDIVLVRPGAAIPADGVVVSGKSAVNESMITGESQLIDKADGAEVLGGTVNGQGSLRIRVLKTGQGTALAGIMRLVSQAQNSRSRAQALADRAAYLLTIVAIVAGGATLAAWFLLGAEIDFTVTRVVTVLVIACPHALGLAVPLVTAISTTLGAQNGLLVRDRRGLEDARNLDTVVFDKTGTLTLGSHRVIEIVATGGVGSDEALSLAAAVERDSEHPIAQALVKSAEDKGLRLLPSSDFEAAAGKGVEANVSGRRLAVGGPAMLRDHNIDLDNDIKRAVARFEESGQAAIFLSEGNRILAAFAVADQVRPESKEAVAKLQTMGIEVAILTGDSEAVARSVARELSIDTVFAGVLPDQKSKKIKELQAQGKRVAMVGDGVNDAPALVTADVGVAVGAGTDVAVEAGDVILVRSDPRDIARIVTLSRASYRKMIQNLWWAAGYNIVAIPLAAGVLYWAGIVLAPAAGAVLMSASTVIVALNAQLLRRLDMER